MHCTAVQRVSNVGFDWIFEIRVGKLMRITCVFNAFSTRIRQGQIDGRYCKTKRFNWLKEKKTHILSLKRVRGRL